MFYSLPVVGSGYLYCFVLFLFFVCLFVCLFVCFRKIEIMNVKFDDYRLRFPIDFG